MPYKLTEEARNDLIALTVYGLERFGEAQARKYLSGLFHTFEMLSDMSGLGRQVPELGERVRRTVTELCHNRHKLVA